MPSTIPVLVVVGAGVRVSVRGWPPARRPPNLMPIYEYRCEACEHRFETLVRGAETPVCPTCGSATLARELSTFAVSTGGSPARYSAAPSPCGTCGDPRGAGSCSMN